MNTLTQNWTKEMFDNQGADVYNYHPLRVGFQKVYSLQKLENLNDAIQSGVEALLRLHE